MTDDLAPRVLHLLHGWGLPSQTFVRSAIRHTPARSFVLTNDVEGRWDGVAERVVQVPPFVHRLPAKLTAAALRTAARAVQLRHRAEIVHCHFAHPLRLADRVATSAGIPLVVSLYGRDALVELPHDKESRSALQRADAVLVLSPFLATSVEDLGIDPAVIQVIPTGVELDEFPPPVDRGRGDGGPLRVLFIGRLVAKKDPLTALAAVERAHVEGTPVTATFIGSGPLHDALRSAAEASGVSVEIRDGSSRTEVLAAFGDHDVLISPSCVASDGDAETLLMVNLEAQASGLPVITTDSGGIASGVGPGAAVVVEERDMGAMAAALVDLAADPQRRRSMGSTGRRWIENEGLATTTGERIRGVYDSVLG